MRLMLVLLVGLCGCQAKPTASDVCAKLEAQGVAKGCSVTAERGGLVGAAKERVNFVLAEDAEKKGQVLSFGTAGELDATAKAFEAAAVLAGRHRYSSPKALIFVQMNAEASDATGAKAKAVVDGL